MVSDEPLILSAYRLLPLQRSRGRKTKAKREERNYVHNKWAEWSNQYNTKDVGICTVPCGSDRIFRICLVRTGGKSCRGIRGHGSYGSDHGDERGIQQS